MGELTLDSSTLKEVWGDEPVALALASMLKAVLEGRVSSSDVASEAPQEGRNGPDVTMTEEEDEPADSEKEARLALVEVFECFCTGMTPCARPVRVLDVNSLLSRKHELSEARKTTVPEPSKDSKTGSRSQSHPAVLLRRVKKGKEAERGKMASEEETVSKLLDLVGEMRKKHKLPPLAVSVSEAGDVAAGDDHAMTFGIVGPDRSSSNRRDTDEGWLLVGRETAAEKPSEDNIYPIRSIYSFFVVLNSGSGTPHSRPSPSGSPEDEIDDDLSASSSNSSTSVSSSEDSPQQDADAALFTTVKQHEDCAWSVLASIHVAGSEAVDGDESSSTCPDVVVVDDPLCIINEYIRYLRGEDATPPPGERKRRRVHVHENIIDRRTCRIRILTAGQSDVPDAAAAEESKAHFLQGQQELLQLLEQKLRKLQQTEEFSSAVTSPCSHSPAPGSESQP